MKTLIINIMEDCKGKHSGQVPLLNFYSVALLTVFNSVLILKVPHFGDMPH